MTTITNCTACELLASIEAMLTHLAERIDQDATGHQADHPNQRGTYHAEQQATLDL